MDDGIARKSARRARTQEREDNPGCQKRLHRELGDDKYRAANNLRMHVAAGWHGRKTGRGFYDYSGK